ncbi:hypothetical protein C6497_11700 [Candidatus Poribacteria bacterium]|nr:MAG: hypothetical protein C6497_11700 [Candidatus Poribacteria bacterium]
MKQVVYNLSVKPVIVSVFEKLLDYRFYSNYEKSHSSYTKSTSNPRMEFGGFRSSTRPTRGIEIAQLSCTIKCINLYICPKLCNNITIHHIRFGIRIAIFLPITDHRSNLMSSLRTILVVGLLVLFIENSNAKIVFSLYQNENSNIYVMDDDGENMRQITDTPYYDKIPYWSPNGKRIAFIRNPSLPDQRRDTNVYMMHADGTGVQQVSDTDFGIIDLAFSSDGKKIAFTRRLSAQYVVDLETGEVRQISRSHINQLDWSPDGKQIIYVNDDHQFIDKHLWMMDANGDNPHAWTKPNPERNVRYHSYPRWSPDGKKILYCELELMPVEIKINDLVINRMGIGHFNYLIQDVDEGGMQRLDIPNNWYCTSLAWMDEGRSVLFSAFEYERDRNPHHPTQIYKYDLTSNLYTHLTEGSGADWHEDALSVSPIGKKSVRWSEIKKAYTGR